MLAIAALLGCCSALLLMLRLESARRGCSPEVAGSAMASARAQLLQTLIEHDLLPEGGPNGLAEISYSDPVDGRPHQLGALLRRLESVPQARTLSEFEAEVQAVYELQVAFRLGDAVMRPLCDIMATHARALQFMGRSVRRVEILCQGALVDRGTMTPLTPGTRVRQPLGMVLRDADGRVLCRPKVLCR